MVSQIYPSELQLNKANTSDTEAAFLDLHLSISNDIVLPKIVSEYIRKYHNHKPQTTLRHREEEPLNHHEIPGRRIRIYDKREDFDFEIVNFPFLYSDVPRSTSYGVYISQLIRIAKASSYVADFNTRNKLLTQKLLKQGYLYHKLRKTFSNFTDDTMI